MAICLVVVVKIVAATVWVVAVSAFYGFYLFSAVAAAIADSAVALRAIIAAGYFYLCFVAVAGDKLDYNLANTNQQRGAVIAPLSLVPP